MTGTVPGASPPRPLDLARLAASHLAAKGVPDARLDAELLLAHVLGLRRLDLYLQFERPLEPDEVDRYRDYVRRRGRREPLQYILGQVTFRELTLQVDPRVLIPRPETELLAGEVLEWARTRAGRRPAAGVLLELGVGSGALVLSLLHEGSFERAVGTDTSEGALAVAASNAAALGLADRLELRRGSTWEPIGERERFSVIVANPPYVAESERDTLMPEVAEHEPPGALYGGPDGLSVVREIVGGAAERLECGGLLALELGLGQAGTVVALADAAGLGSTRVVSDLTGRERMVLAVRA